MHDCINRDALILRLPTVVNDERKLAENGAPNLRLGKRGTSGDTVDRMDLALRTTGFPEVLLKFSSLTVREKISKLEMFARLTEESGIALYFDVLVVDFPCPNRALWGYYS